MKTRYAELLPTAALILAMLGCTPKHKRRAQRRQGLKKP